MLGKGGGGWAYKNRAQCRENHEEFPEAACGLERHFEGTTNAEIEVGELPGVV
jgi:DICT domain-containing protein